MHIPFPSFLSNQRKQKQKQKIALAVKHLHVGILSTARQHHQKAN
jgi:hypothetical protein